MSNSSTSLVHEAEAQRQYTRIPLQAETTIAGVVCDVKDWSNGGVGLQAHSAVPQEVLNGSAHQLEVHFRFPSFTFQAEFSVIVTHVDAGTRNIGCRFDSLNKDQIALVHYLTTAYLSGEVIQAGDLLDMSTRNYDVKPRSVPKETSPTARDKIWKLCRYVGVVALLLTLISVIITALYERNFVIAATSAKVTAPLVSADAQDGGKVYFLSGETGDMVKKGQPLATIYTAAGNALSIDSPCECIIAQYRFENNRLVRKGDPLVDLVTINAATQIEAYIPYHKAVDIRTGDEALLSLPGEAHYFRGRVKRVQAAKSDSGTSRVVITPTEALPADSINQPVSVRIDRLQWL